LVEFRQDCEREIIHTKSAPVQIIMDHPFDGTTSSLGASVTNFEHVGESTVRRALGLLGPLTKEKGSLTGL
jgi:hypothetical protein